MINFKTFLNFKLLSYETQSIYFSLLLIIADLQCHFGFDTLFVFLRFFMFFIFFIIFMLLRSFISFKRTGEWLRRMWVDLIVSYFCFTMFSTKAINANDF